MMGNRSRPPADMHTLQNLSARNTNESRPSHMYRYIGYIGQGEGAGKNLTSAARGWDAKTCRKHAEIAPTLACLISKNIYGTPKPQLSSHAHCQCPHQAPDLQQPKQHPKNQPCRQATNTMVVVVVVVVESTVPVVPVVLVVEYTKYLSLEQ